MLRSKLTITVAVAFFALLFSQCDTTTKPENKPPVCRITAPAENDTISQGDTVRIAVEATDEDGDISEVTFYIDDSPDYTTTQVPYHYDWNTQDVTLGEHTIRVTVEDDKGETASDEIMIAIIFKNTPPEACFEYSVEADLLVSLDASCCSDKESDTTDLFVRWDWDGDGAWDTDFSKSKHRQYQYSATGNYYARLMVRDAQGLTDSIVNKIKVLEYGSVTDIDGNRYRTVKIGEQWWMAENLKVTHYRDGREIPYTSSGKVWKDRFWNQTGTYCAYDFDKTYADTYGYLYNWYTVNSDTNLIAPEGWHIATFEDWEELAQYISDDNGGYEVENYPDGKTWHGVGRHLKANYGWKAGGGPNKYGFSALPGAFRHDIGQFGSNIGHAAYFWSKNGELGKTRFRSLGGLKGSGGLTYTITYKGAYGFSVRCVKDKE